MTRAADLSLYHFDACPFCVRVRRALDRLGVEVELCDVQDEPRHMGALVAARGKRTVPVLRIAGADGRDQWMPESSDIVKYLERRFGAA